MVGTNQQIPRAGGSYTKGMTINGVTYGLIYLSAIPLLFFLWRVGKASIGTKSMFFLGMIGMIFLIQYLDQFIPKDVLLALAFLLAGVGK